jgi:phage gp29-like protein
MKILDQYGKPLDTGVLKEPQTARVRSLENQYLIGNLNGLTPARLAATLTNADNGDLWAQHRLFADMEERDAHLAAEMGKRKLALLGLEWSIEPPRNASAVEKAHAEWLTEVLTDAVDPVEDLILAAMDGVGHGFSAIELEWRAEGKEWLPAFFPRPQEWFRLDPLRREIRLRDDSIADGSPLALFGWVFHTHGKAKTGYLGRMGLHRALSWPFIYKAYAIGDFAEFLETFGLPIIVGKYFAGASNEEKASLMHAVSALGHDARAIMPLEMTLEVQKVTGGTGGNETPHLALVDWAERSESKLIVGQTMSAESKASGIGSGNADLHREVRHDILKADARQIAGTLTRDLLYPLVALNRGQVDGLARCPRFVFDTGESEDVKQMSEAWPKLVGVGMEIPLEYAHQKLKIPMPSQAEKILTIASPPNVLDPALRPEPGKATPNRDKASKETALAARFGERSIAERDAFEELAEQMSGDWEPTLAPLLAPVRRLIDECATLEEFRDRLPEVVERMNITALHAPLSDNLFAAHLAGRVIPGRAASDG